MPGKGFLIDFGAVQADLAAFQTVLATNFLTRVAQ